MKIHWKCEENIFCNHYIENGYVKDPFRLIGHYLTAMTPRNKELYITSYGRYSDRIHLAPKLRIQASIRIQKILKKRTKEIIEEIQSESTKGIKK